jgi:hypothetical protein
MKQFGKKVRRGLGVFAFAMAVAAVSHVSAQNMSGTVVTKEVRFAKGTHASTVRGSAKYGMSYLYKLGGKAGQTINVSVKAKSRELTFSVIGPDDETLADAFGVTEFSGTLPKAGKYSIVVVMNDQNASPMPFTMTAGIK